MGRKGGAEGRDPSLKQWRLFSNHRRDKLKAEI